MESSDRRSRDAACAHGLARVSHATGGRPIQPAPCLETAEGQPGCSRRRRHAGRHLLAAACAAGADTDAFGRGSLARDTDGSRSPIAPAIKQVLTPIFDPDFSELSFGFRPGRGAHGAVRQRSSDRHGKQKSRRTSQSQRHSVPDRSAEAEGQRVEESGVRSQRSGLPRVHFPREQAALVRQILREAQAPRSAIDRAQLGRVDGLPSTLVVG